jgi:hypothetical protein
VSVPRISICVPSRGSPERLFRLLGSARDFTAVDYEVVVVDCGREMRGYTATQNQAMAAGRGDFLLAVNDDVVLTPGWAEPLVAALEAGAWSSSPDMEHSDGPQFVAPYCWLWCREAWAAMGGLDEQFVHWCSDIDMGHRLADRGQMPVRIRLEQPIAHLAGEKPHDQEVHSHFSAVVRGDLDRYRTKWGITAEEDKVRLRDMVWTPA